MNIKMESNNYGKIIGKVDESKKFQQKCLNHNGKHCGKGIDIETIYYAKEMDVNGNVVNNDKYQYYIFEYLKDDCNYNISSSKYYNIPSEPIELQSKLTPWKSDPNKYSKNWRKFLSLYNISNLLNGQLVLVNYSDGFVKDKNTNKYISAIKGFDNEVKVMYVDKLNFDIIRKLNTTSSSISQNYISFSQVKCMTFDEYAVWLQKMNENCKLPTVYDKNNSRLFP